MTKKPRANKTPAPQSVAPGGPETWPASTVVLRRLDTITPYHQNPMDHSDEQIDLIAKSMAEDGVYAPILLDEAGVIIYGHGRRLAALKNGYEVYPMCTAIGWSEEKKRAVRIKDNALPRLANWNPALLKVELADLKNLGYDMPLLGLTDVQLVSFMATAKGSDPDKAPELAEKPISRPGDVWIMGKHRLICGDCTQEADVEAVMDGKSPVLMITDPPYGVDYNPNWRAGISNAWGKPRGTGTVQNDDRADWTPAWKLFRGNVAYVWCASMTNDAVIQSLEAADLKRRAQIIWNKPHFAIGRGDYHWQHECCWYAVRNGKPGNWAGDRKQSTVWDILNANAAGGHRDEGFTGHGTQKPIECMRRPIQNNSKPGEFIYDPFMGSGSTIIAAELMNRFCLGVEIDPRYVDLAVQRWQTYAKAEATLMIGGKTFAEVGKERAKPKPKSGARKKVEAKRKPPGPKSGRRVATATA